jgi:hypothetical protein
MRRVLPRLVRCRLRPRLQNGEEGATFMKKLRWHGHQNRGESPPFTASLASAVGALAVGALALGAGAVGALAVGRLAIRRAAIQYLRIEELEVGRLKVSDLEVQHERRSG